MKRAADILGLSMARPGSAACLLRGGRIVAGAEEERFTRRKNDSAFPRETIRWLLRDSGFTGVDIGAVGVCAGQGDAGGDRAHALLRETCGYAGDILTFESHAALAQCAFAASGFTDAAVVVMDMHGGDGMAARVYRGDDEGLSPLLSVATPHSLERLATAFTVYLGFEPGEGEFKTMGLASYGKPVFLDALRSLLTLREDGGFTLNEGLSQLAAHLDRPPRKAGEPVLAFHQNVAASAQALIEEALLHVARAALRMSGSRRLCVAGGLAHNIAANARLRASGLFQDVHAHFAGGGGGAAMGAALLAARRDSGSGCAQIAPADPFLGPVYGEAEMGAALARQGCRYERLEQNALLAAVADMLARDAVVGWFQGRMEYGPRALGHRSFLASPCHAEMKDILNARVKRREDFRPFAPAVLREAAATYFVMENDSPHMMFACPVRDNQRGVIPAVTHVDGTARVQTVAEEDDPLFHGLLRAFADRAGVPVLLNTSFNLRGEPIVRSPDDAARCFLASGIEAMAIGPFLARRKG